MSTTCKLNPVVRTARKMRVELLEHFQIQLNAIRKYPLSPERNAIEGFCVTTIDVMRRLIRDPSRTGEQKNAICQRIAREFKKLAAGMPQPEAP